MNESANQSAGFDSAEQLRAAAVDRHQAGDLTLARDYYRRYLALCPDDASMWSNLGALFRGEKNFDMAMICQQKAIRLDGAAPHILNNAANAYFDGGDVEEALALRRRALASEPDKAENWATLGRYLRALGQHEAAIAAMDDALERFADDVEINIQRAFAILSTGDYPTGFEAFDWRWQGDEISLPEFDMPRWSGEDLTGKTIVVTPEQGFGDTLLMARFLTGLAQRGARVRMVCKPPLRRVLAGAPGLDQFVDTKADLSDCDLWTPMMDLPRYLGVRLDTVPPPVKLTVPTDSLARAQSIVAPFRDCLKIGVLWSGSVTYRGNHKRSFSHTRFLPLAKLPGVQLFSLYKGPLLDDFHSDGTSCVIVDAAGQERDFADTAALIGALDLVITMDSAIAHLAGALGAPVWNLLHSEAYWLYEPFVDHTPWYPSMRLIRQPTSGDWDGVFSLLLTEVEDMARGRL